MKAGPEWTERSGPAPASLRVDEPTLSKAGGYTANGDLETARAATAVGVSLLYSTLPSRLTQKTCAASRDNLLFFNDAAGRF